MCPETQMMSSVSPCSSFIKLVCLCLSTKYDLLFGLAHLCTFSLLVFIMVKSVDAQRHHCLQHALEMGPGADAQKEHVRVLGVILLVSLRMLLFRITQLVFPVTSNEWMWTALKVAFEPIFQDSSFKMVNLSSRSIPLIRCSTGCTRIPTGAENRSGGDRAERTPTTESVGGIPLSSQTRSRDTRNAPNEAPP